MGRTYRWFAERSPIGEIVGFLRRKRVPVHRHASWYLFGGLTLFFFIVQVVSGVLLTFYYQPTPETAHDSVARIMGNVGFGWLVRGVHKWASHLLILCAIIHMSSKYFFRAYRKPRELTWLSGVLLMLFLLGFAFTGHLLPWDTNGYFATQIGTEIPGTLPVVGPLIVKLMRGGSEFVEATTLTRMYSLHTVVFPLAGILIILIHILQNQFTGSAMPLNARKTGETPFFPDFMYRDALAWLAGTMALFTLVLFFPPQLGPKADMLASPPPGIHPEWYFLPLYQAIRLMPGSIAGLHSEILINSLLAVLVISLMLLPWIDRGRGRVITVAGVSALLYTAVSIVLTYSGL